ncbi:periplasmic heavy metal sensor [Sulfurimonas sp. HSL-3221]|uniref:Spy/CpxP family protein refolding chaperone n=1 Tax=Sulfurimonadaceae TaxID=2771471 RepID=UPI001E314719|nr:periplasmic heavy metal sensor [Sulfurimonas sp. HSL-3221]UFS61867.1 periplasmic heavy metal sensor [Sulfurimonas sp. HSL-3221]
MRFIVLIALLFTLLAADHDDHREHHMPMDISYLDLTPQQHERVEKIARDYRKAHHRLNRLEAQTRDAVRALFEAERFDRAKFLELTTALQTENDRVQADFFEALHAVLTPQQRQRFTPYLEEWERD